MKALCAYELYALHEDHIALRQTCEILYIVTIDRNSWLRSRSFRGVLPSQGGLRHSHGQATIVRGLRDGYMFHCKREEKYSRNSEKTILHSSAHPASASSLPLIIARTKTITLAPRRKLRPRYNCPTPVFLNQLSFFSASNSSALALELTLLRR